MAEENTELLRQSLLGELAREIAVAQEEFS